MGYRINKKMPFTVTERRGKDGNITIIRHNANGFRTLAFCGKCKTPKGLSDSTSLFNTISSIGYELLHQFPAFFNQKRSSAILTYTLPAVEDRETSRGLHYSFQYTMNDGSDNETVISQVLPLIPIINEKISACTKQALEQASDPVRHRGRPPL